MVARCSDIDSEEYRLGQKIRKYRLAKGLTQNNLADLMDMDRANIANYENGSKGEMGFKLLIRFAQALEVTLDELIYMEPEADTFRAKISRLDTQNRKVLEPIVESLLLRQDMAY